MKYDDAFLDAASDNISNLFKTLELGKSFDYSTNVSSMSFIYEGILGAIAEENLTEDVYFEVTDSILYGIISGFGYGEKDMEKMRSLVLEFTDIFRDSIAKKNFFKNETNQ
ncbi:MAG: hypothetical protein K9M57_05835 [Phycisphaerae bacterium]|nr:hypothetical protein [Phycisphaerae bacterium]